MADRPADAQRYEQADLPFYRSEIAPMLPPVVLDFHAHTWSADDWRATPWETDAAGGRYMVTTEQYPPETLLADGRRCFPDREYQAVCFGCPTPAADWEKDTAFVAAAARNHAGLHPLVLAGKGLGIPRERYERALTEGHFFGFKVFLPWHGDNYGDTRVEDMLGPVETALANERRLVVMLHVPGRGRLADPAVQRGVRWLAGECPNAHVVLAHCGRCYLPAEMKAAIGSIRGLPNVSMETSMVMDPVVIQMVLGEIGPERLMYGTDFPVAAMRGRRVRVMDHWVDVVLPGYPESAFRVAASGIRATSMAWEIALAIRWAAEMAGLRASQLHDIFHGNGARILQAADGGRPWRVAASRRNG